MHFAQEPISIDDIIARRKISSNARKRKRDAEVRSEDIRGERLGNCSGDQSCSEEDEEFGEQEESDPLMSEEDMDAEAEDEETEGCSSDSSDETEPETQLEKDRKAAFFDSDVISSEVHTSFLTTNLSRPILKAITALGFHKPTPIQAATIPVALLGKDVVGGAVTGSGKTAAFMIPMLERLLYRCKGKNAAATRCLVLVPTRELAVQCFDVGTKLAIHTDIRFCLLVGTNLVRMALCKCSDFLCRWTSCKVSRGATSESTRYRDCHSWTTYRSCTKFTLLYIGFIGCFSTRRSG
jgi:ATP-dependent RNA helicase DDX27